MATELMIVDLKYRLLRHEDGNHEPYLESLASYRVEVAPERFTSGPMAGEAVQGEWVVGYRGGQNGWTTLRRSYPSPEAAQEVADRDFGLTEVHERYPVRFWRDGLGVAHVKTDDCISGVVELSPATQAAMLPALEATRP